ncbi:MAG: hypothetical protein ACRDVP_12525 [Acidimicrobiales bacterium]
MSSLLAGVDRGATGAFKGLLRTPLALAPGLPQGGIQRGSLVGVSGAGGTTLLFSLLVEWLAQGSWAAVVGPPDLGLEAASAMGVDMERLALIPCPGSGWADVVTVLLGSLDLVVLRPPVRCRPQVARRLAARVREQGSILVLTGGMGWPDTPDIDLIVVAGAWEGLGLGSGTLKRRPATVTVSGRRAGTPRKVDCWLPGTDGRLSPRESIMSSRVEMLEPEQEMSCAG